MTWPVRSEAVYRATAMGGTAERPDEHLLAKPSEEELMEFVMEAGQVVATFADLAHADAEVFSRAVEELRGGTNG